MISDMFKTRIINHFFISEDFKKLRFFFGGSTTFGYDTQHSDIDIFILKSSINNLTYTRLKSICWKSTDFSKYSDDLNAESLYVKIKFRNVPDKWDFSSFGLDRQVNLVLIKEEAEFDNQERRNQKLFEFLISNPKILTLIQDLKMYGIIEKGSGVKLFQILYRTFINHRI